MDSNARTQALHTREHPPHERAPYIHASSRVFWEASASGVAAKTWLKEAAEGTAEASVERLPPDAFATTMWNTCSQHFATRAISGDANTSNKSTKYESRIIFTRIREDHAQASQSAKPQYRPSRDTRRARFRIATANGSTTSRIRMSSASQALAAASADSEAAPSIARGPRAQGGRTHEAAHSIARGPGTRRGKTHGIGATRRHPRNPCK